MGSQEQITELHDFATEQEANIDLASNTHFVSFEQLPRNLSNFKRIDGDISVQDQKSSKLAKNTTIFNHMFAYNQSLSINEIKQEMIEIPLNTVPLFGDMFSGLSEQK